MSISFESLLRTSGRWTSAVAGVVLAMWVIAAPYAQAQKNVVVIISDDAGWADYGFMRAATSAADPGSRGAVPTPNLDALAAAGVTFTNAYTATVCSSSRAMLVTGQYGTRFGYGTNILDSPDPINAVETVQGLPPDIETIWERMQGVGYDTAAVGKWHLGYHPNGGGQLGNRPENQGIELFQGLWGGSRNYIVGGESGVQALRETISDGSGVVASNAVIEGNYAGQYVTDVFGDQSASYIRDRATNGDAPFFLYSSFTGPHTPMQATAADLAYIDSLNDSGFVGNRRTYAAMHYAMDRNVGKILGAINDPNNDGNTIDSILEDTLVIFLNDNGGDCCDVDPNASDNGVLRNGKGSVFEGGMRVPIIVAGGGVSQAARGTVSADLVHSIDVTPTALVGAAGGAFASTDVVDGVNLLPYINDESAGVAHQELFHPRYGNLQSAIRVGKWKYLYQTTGYQLYDLEADEDESSDLINYPAHAATAAELHQRLASYHVQMDKARHDNQAPETNQFDHLRFREGAFTSANFSTADAWTNGDTNTGVFTASWRDGYANAELTFRTKPNGNFSVTNDLTSAGGFPFMANQLTLAGQAAPLAGQHTATIGGNALLLVKSREGAAPTVNLDAVDAAAGAFTFNVDAELQTYDDLVIDGEGNQRFRLNGKIKEFRPGRQAVKRGASTVWLGGGVELTGPLVVEAGAAEFATATVKASQLIAQAGSTIRVGGVGFGESQVSVTPGPQPVTSKLALEYDAAQDAGGDAVWNPTSRSEAIGLAFTGAATAAPASDSLFQRVSAAYDTGSVGGATSPGAVNTYFEQGSPVRSRTSGTFEVVFRVNDLNAGANQVLLDIGATRGLSLVLDNSQLQAGVDGDGPTLAQSIALTPGWHQAVVVIDLVNGVDGIANDKWSLYLNNSLVGTQSNVLIGDWAGGNNWGVGQQAGTTLDPSGATTVLTGAQAFHGDVAQWRYYHDLAFTAADVAQNYQSLLVGDTIVSEIVATTLTVEGDLVLQSGARLELDLFDPATHDAVETSGAAALDGALAVSGVSGFAPQAGDTYSLLSAAGGLTGTFNSVELPTLTGPLRWLVEYDAHTVTASVVLGADFNEDGIVDGADFLAWQQGLGATGQTDNSRGDASGDGSVDARDLEIWRVQFGTTGGAGNAAATVPEASTQTGMTCGALLMAMFRRAPAKPGDRVPDASNERSPVSTATQEASRP